MHALLTYLMSGNGTGIGISGIDPAGSGNLPGEAQLEGLASGVGHWALLASIVGIFAGGVMWGSLLRPGRHGGGSYRRLRSRVPRLP
jgi:hypothetical protein